MAKYINIKSTTLLSLAIAITFSSCKDDDPEIKVPTTYEFIRDGVSTVSFSGQTTRILMAEELAIGMSDFNQSTTSLQEMYVNEDATGGDVSPFSDADLNASTKSIKSKVAASTDLFSTNTTEAAAIKSQLEQWILSQVNEVFPNENELAEAGKAGQIADGTSTRYISAKGLEYNQAVAKSLIGALMTDQILNNYLSPDVLDESNNIADNDAGILADGKAYTSMEHNWDEAYGYLFGKSSFEKSPLIDLGADNFLNKYLSSVDEDDDFTGIAQEVFDAFKEGRAAIVSGAYETRDKQADIIKEKISNVIGIRAVYYLQQGKKAIEIENYGGAFHELSEGFGFVYSLRFTRDAGTSNSKFSSTEIESFTSQLLEGNGFWDVAPATLDAISETIAAKFDFTVAQAAE
ncbi:MAG: hypothetical protein ACJA1A_000819 [Saprospiraceae bacterium]|jgi:hypothetical protein|tara:strand:+ start:949 stop:2163 length:1215 start_codon:yes stop_codon:yes gene_type:complete